MHGACIMATVAFWHSTAMCFVDCFFSGIFAAQHTTEPSNPRPLYFCYLYAVWYASLALRSHVERNGNLLNCVTELRTATDDFCYVCCIYSQRVHFLLQWQHVCVDALSRPLLYLSRSSLCFCFNIRTISYMSLIVIDDIICTLTYSLPYCPAAWTEIAA